MKKISDNKTKLVHSLIKEEENESESINETIGKNRKFHKSEKIPMVLSLKNSLKEEFYDHGIKIIEKTKLKVLELIELYFSNLLIEYKLNILTEEKQKYDLFLSNRISDDSSPSKEIKKIMMNSDKLEQLPLFLKEIIYLNGPSSPQKKSIQNIDNTKPKPKKFIISSKFIDFSNYLHVLLPKFNTLFLYNIKSESSLYVSIQKKGSFEIPASPSTYLFGDYIFAFSGYRNGLFSDISNETYRINIKSYKMKSLEARTNYNKISSGICSLDKFIYSIGGKKENLVRTNLCERFNVESYKWGILPAMKYIRSFPSVNVFNKNLYVFFGIDENGKPTYKIESLNILTLEWVEIFLNNNNTSFFHNYHQVSCIQINEDEILLFGGYKNHEKLEGNDELIIINIKQKEAYKENKTHPLVQGCSQACPPLINESNEIICLRYISNEISENIGEFEDIFSVSAISNENIKILEVLNCRHLEKILKNK